MNGRGYQRWRALHLRAVLGEALKKLECSEGQAGCRDHDAHEFPDGNLERLRALRIRIARAEAKPESLQSLEAELESRIGALERQLDDRTCLLLGITTLRQARQPG